MIISLSRHASDLLLRVNKQMTLQQKEPQSKFTIQPLGNEHFKLQIQDKSGKGNSVKVNAKTGETSKHQFINDFQSFTAESFGFFQAIFGRWVIDSTFSKRIENDLPKEIKQQD